MMPGSPAIAQKPLETALRRAPRGPVHLVPFIPGGFGGFEATRAALRAVADAGASAIEVGIPFSDPIADGPVIQAAYHEALEAGITVEGVLESVRHMRESIAVAMLAMVSYSIVFRGGVEAFCGRAKRAGLDGLLCPDLPPPEAAAFCEIATGVELEPVLLVAPTTPAARRDQIARLAGGFVYYMSVAGITGERSALPPELAGGVADMKRRTSLPVCVGFGIGRGEQVAGLRGIADGAVVGSAYVRRMREALGGGTEKVAEACSGLTRELLNANL